MQGLESKTIVLVVGALLYLGPTVASGSAQLAGEVGADSFVANISQGEALESRGQYGLAEASFRSALAIDRASVDAMVHLASVLDKEHRLDAAVHYWTMASALRPNDVQLRSMLGAAYLEDGQNEAAIAALEIATGKLSLDGAALINLGTALTRCDRYVEAQEVYRRALALPEFAETANLSLVKVLITLARYSEAIPTIESYVRVHPKNAEGRSLLGITYQGLGRNTEADRELRLAVAQTSADFDSQYHLGSVLRSEANDREAIVHLKQAILLRPQSREAHYQAARCYRSLHDVALANAEERTIREIETARATDTHVVILENEARQAQKEHDLDKAAAIYQQILVLLPMNAKVKYDLALLYEQQGDRRRERCVLEDAMKQDPSMAALHSQLGFLDIMEGQAEKGESELRVALTDDPQNVEALGNLGVLEAERGRFLEAEHFLQLAVESDSSYEKGFLNLGLVLAAQGRYASAEDALTSATSLNPGNTSSRRALEQVRLSAQEARIAKP